MTNWARRPTDPQRRRLFDQRAEFDRLLRMASPEELKVAMQEMIGGASRRAIMRAFDLLSAARDGDDG